MLVAASFCWFLASSLWIYPHSLSYFNESIGGPLNGPNHLMGSNVDWGQDLRYIKWWLDGTENRCVRLAYYGFVFPEDVGVSYTLPAAAGCAQPQISDTRHDMECRHCAVSVSFLFGHGWHAPNGQHRKIWLMHDSFSHFEDLVPTEIMGYSIYVFTDPVKKHD
jgi:hypothetical protein